MNNKVESCATLKTFRTLEVFRIHHNTIKKSEKFSINTHLIIIQSTYQKMFGHILFFIIIIIKLERELKISFSNLEIQSNLAE